MHELAIAESIVQTVVQEMERKGYIRVLAVGMRIGELPAVVPEALEFGFDAITQDTVLEGTKLEIERVSLVGRCQRCGRSFPVEKHVFVCPHCQGVDIAIVQGDELDITYLEVADDAVE